MTIGFGDVIKVNNQVILCTPQQLHTQSSNPATSSCKLRQNVLVELVFGTVVERMDEDSEVRCETGQKVSISSVAT